MRVRSPQNTLGPPIQSNDQQPTQYLRQADVQVLLGVVVPHIINFCACFSPPNSLLLCTPIAIYMVYFPKKFGFSPFYTYLCPSYHINDVANGNLSRLATVKFCIDRCPIGVWQILPMCSQHGFLSVLNNCPPSSFFISSSERLFDYL